jgi:hypothetical protein
LTSDEAEKVKIKSQEVASKNDRIKEVMDELASTKADIGALKTKSATHMQNFERQAFARWDAEHRAERMKQNTESFDDMKASLEAKVCDYSEEVSQLKAIRDIPKHDAEAQASIDTSEASMQTDLSYQYLESSERLQGDPGRMERMSHLKKASHFVEDPEEQRDFSMSSSITSSFRQTGGSMRQTGGSMRKSSGSMQATQPLSEASERATEKSEPSRYTQPVSEASEYATERTQPSGYLPSSEPHQVMESGLDSTIPASMAHLNLQFDPGQATARNALHHVSSRPSVFTKNGASSVPLPASGPRHPAPPKGRATVAAAMRLPIQSPR